MGDKMTLDEAGKLLDKHKKEEGFTFRGAVQDIKAKIVEGVETGKRKANRFLNQREADRKAKERKPKPKKEGLGCKTRSLLDRIDD